MYKSLIKGLLFKLFDFFRPLIIIPFFVRQYGIESYGIYVQIIFLSSLFYPILDLGIGTSIQRFYKILNDKSKFKEISKVQTIIIILFIIVYIAIIESSNIKHIIYGNIDNFNIVITSIIYIILFSLNNTLQGVMRANSEISSLVKFRFLFAIIEVIILLLVIYFHKKFDYVYIGCMCVCQLFYYLIMSRKCQCSLISLPFNISLSSENKSFIKYSLSIIPIGLVGWITASSDRFFITNYFGAEQTGYYSAISQYTSYIKLIVFPFTFVYFKEYCKTFEENRNKFTQLFNKSIVLCATLSVIYIILFYCFRNFIFNTYMGIDIKPELNFLTIGFLIIYFLQNIYSFASMYLLIVKKTKLILISVLSGSIINLLLNIFILKYKTYEYAINNYIISVIVQLIIILIYITYTIKNDKNTFC